MAYACIKEKRLPFLDLIGGGGKRGGREVVVSAEKLLGTLFVQGAKRSL